MKIGKRVSKKGVSPIIASVLLITLVVILGALIFIWARGFFKDVTEKNGKSAEQVCDEISLSVSKFASGIDIVNSGHIPLGGVRLKKISSGKTSTETITFPQGLSAGQTTTLNSSVNYDKIIVIPAIIGTANNENKLYVCGEDKGKTI